MVICTYKRITCGGINNEIGNGDIQNIRHVERKSGAMEMLLTMVQQGRRKVCIHAGYTCLWQLFNIKASEVKVSKFN